MLFRGCSIRKRLFLLILVVLIPILILQASIYYDGYQARRATALEANLEMARMVAQVFGAFTNDIFRHELAIGIGLTSLSSANQEKIQEILDINKEDYSAILEFTWVNPVGEVIASTRPQMIGQNIRERTYFREIVSGKEKVISDLMESKATGGPIFTLSRGMRDQDGKLLGVVVAAIEPERLDEMLASRRVETGKITLFDTQARLVYRYPKADLSWEERTNGNRYQDLRKALEGREVTTVLFSKLEKKERLVAFVPIGNTGWVAAAGVSDEEAMAPALSRLKHDAFLLFLVALAVSLAAMAFSRGIASPIKRLRDQAVFLGRGDLLSEVEIVDPPELKDLADAFNAMVEKVRSREESLLEIQSELERKVQERTADLTKANEVLRAEIGERERAQEDLQAANEELQLNNEELIGTREEVELERGRYRDLFENAPHGYLVTDIEGNIIEGNAAATTLLNAHGDSLKGVPFSSFVTEEDREAFPGKLTNLKQIGGEGVQNWEIFLNPYRGDVFPAAISISVVRYPHLDSAALRWLIRDISERKRAEEALEHKILAMTQPNVELGQLKLTDIIGLSVLQKLQDGFSDSYGIPSLIWDPDGYPITKASNFTPFCKMARSSSKGFKKCKTADRRVGEIALQGVPLIQYGCVIEEIMRAAIPIAIQGHHLATWGMGQVVEGDVDESKIREYAREIEVDAEELVQASKSFPRISVDRFKAAAKFLGIVAGQVSLLGLQNLQQARLIHERKQAEEALQGSERELRFLSIKLLSAHEEERKRIAREIHDSLGSSLSAIKISLENTRRQFDQGKVDPELLEIPIAWTQHLIDEARRLMSELRPSVLDDMGVLAAIEWFLRQYRATYPGIHVEEEIRIEEGDIPVPLKTAIFRITQEAFHNIAKYSRAEFVSYSFKKSTSAIELAIEDAGDGFALQAALSKSSDSRGLGLTSMKDRTELSGGTFHLSSIIGEGTVIRASWPIVKPV